ncbi:MAG TPA: MFS transporter [Spirochaetia bacterium]|nr:MFS transporter [Spirochaetia bacterium]
MTGLPEARDRRLFLAASVLMGLGACVNSAAFNNYLKDAFALDVARRTFLEFPRELPGFLVSLFVASLALLGEVRIAMIANLAAGAGMLALGWIPASYGLMIATVFVYSSGAHVYMPLGNAIGMSFAAEGDEGSALGRFAAANTLALVAGSVTLLALFSYASLSYRGAFSAGAAFYLSAAACFLAMSPRHRPGPRPRFVLRREYSRYYLISVLYGARKQLFITFGPWMLVDLFRQPVSTMTFLFLLVSLLGVVVKPAVGRLTDRFGPRAVLGGEAFLTVGVCLAYAFAPSLLPAGAALAVVAACYVFDQASDAVSMTRAVYVKRMVRRPEDLSPTLSAGISIDHAVSMFLPMLGGLAWRSGGEAGYRWVFLGGAAVAALNFIVTRGLPGRRPEAPGAGPILPTPR